MSVTTAMRGLGRVIARRAAGAETTSHRRRLTLVLLAALALDYADRSLVGGAAPALKSSFHITNTQLGLVASAFSLVGAFATLPIGALTDRVRRTSLFGWTIGGWALAMAAAGAAWSFTALLAARIALGGLTATGGPTTISLIGDAFPSGARAGRLGAVQSGELLGTGLGYVVAGVSVALVSWRAGFWALAIAGAGVAIVMRRCPEPDRGRDGGRASFAGALRLVLTVRTNQVVLAADSLGNFFLACVRTFAVVYTVDRFHVSQGEALPLVALVGFGAVAGVAGGGWLSDMLLRRGVRGAPIGVAAGGYCFAAAVLSAAFLTSTLAAAVPLFGLGAMFLGAPGPALGSVRLDVIPPRVWGRAEAVRTLMRVVVEASAPLIFGVLADRLGSTRSQGVEWSFLATLPCVLAAGLVIIAALRSYPRDRVDHRR